MRITESRLRALFRKRKLDAEMDEEMRAHIEMRTKENITAGMKPDEARYAALQQFGWVESIKDTCRDQRGITWIENVVQDGRYGVRMLHRNPGFATVAILTLALGISANTAIFSVVNGVLLRPLPYAKPDRLVRIYTEFPTFPNGGLHRFAASGPEFLDLRRESRSWESLDAWQNSGANLAGKGEPSRVTASFVSGGLLNSLGVPPAQGRLIAPADDAPGAPGVANISYGLWRRSFGGDSNILGQEIVLDGRKCTVIGVMPKGFGFPLGEIDQPDLWTPLQIDPANPGGPSAHSFWLLGRLKPGVSLAQAQAELNTLVTRSAETASAGGHNFDPQGHILICYGLHEEVVRGIQLALRMLLGAVCFVLLIACVNVANLLLARAEVRQREIAIRGALGASVWRLMVQFVMEGLLLAALGALLGLALAYTGVALLKAAGDATIPRASEISFDTNVFLFAVAVCLMTGIIFGLTPLMHVVRQRVYEALKSAATATTAATNTQRFRQALVVSELALAFILLIGSGLMLRAFWKLQEVNPGFNPQHVLTAFVSLPEATYRDPQTIRSFWTRLEERLSPLPGFDSIALATGLPPVHASVNWDTEIEAFVQVPKGPIQNLQFFQFVSKDYFNAFGIRLVEGRLFDKRDGWAAPQAAIVNQTTARTFWGNQSAIGRRIRPHFDGPWWTVVGVVADVKNAGLQNPTGAELYLPLNQIENQSLGMNRNAYITVRFSSKPATIVKAVRRAVSELDAALPLARIRTMDEVMSMAQSRPRFLTVLLTLFSSVALALAAVGIYGVISYAVVQRTKEFGLRMALGAQRRDVLAMVLGRGLWLTLVGGAIGVAIALALTRFLSSLLFGITPTDPTTFIAVSLLLGLVAVLASYIPARRATKVDPMVALRYE